MLETPHVALGAAIAINVGNPLLALPLSLFSHFLLEPLPHWNPHTYTEVTTKGKLSKATVAIIWADALTGLFLGLWLALQTLPDKQRFLQVIFACFLAVLPDLIEAPFFFFGWKPKILMKLIQFQRSIQYDVSWLPGFIFQAIVVLILVNWAIQ